MKNLFVFFVFISSVSFGQVLPIDYDTLAYENEIILNGKADYGATAVNKELSSKFLYGGTITDDIKDRSYIQHNSTNRVGIDFGSDIEYRGYNVKPFKKKDWGIVAKGGYHAFGGMIYSEDLFGLVFYGNKRYLGDTLSMSGTDFMFTSFQKIGFGLIDRKSKSNITLNFYNIDNRITGHFRELELAQSEEGDEVRLSMDGEIDLMQNKTFSQGVGVGLDLEFILPISWSESNTAYIRFLARNVGVGFMTQNQKRYSTDTSITYTGFKFDQIVGDESIFSDSITATQVLDSIGVHSSDVKPVFLLPGYMEVAKIVDELSDAKLQPFFGVRVYPTLIYSPYIYGGIDWKCAHWLRIGGNLSFGGFTGIRGGLYASAKWKNYSLGLSTETLSGLVSAKASGQSIFLRVGCRF